jgi:PAT family beta-lactamase induction signal transducer AmpG
MTESSLSRNLFNRRMLICIFTGFSSGLPLYIIYQLIPLWLNDKGVDLEIIGFFALVGIPYTFKFIWSPFMERYPLPFLGHRRGWILFTQITLFFVIAILGFMDPKKSILLIAFFSIVVAFFSATQDISIDAYRRELLKDSELGVGNNIHVQAYRIAGLVPGSLAPILSDHISWQLVFLIVASFMFIGVLFTLSISEPVKSILRPKTAHDAILQPLNEFFSRKGLSHALIVLCFIFLYKLGDSMATALAYPFYQDLGFSKTDIGIIAKNAALWSSILGGFIAIPIIAKLGINKCLWLFGFIQLASIVGFWFLSETGPDKLLFAFVVSFEYLGVGLGTASYIAYIARETNIQFAATQFALLTAISALPRTFANSFSGVIVESIGWSDFYIFCCVLALPGMLLLIKVAPWSSQTNDSKLVD